MLFVDRCSQQPFAKQLYLPIESQGHKNETMHQKCIILYMLKRCQMHVCICWKRWQRKNRYLVTISGYFLCVKGALITQIIFKQCITIHNNCISWFQLDFIHAATCGREKYYSILFILCLHGHIIQTEAYYPRGVNFTGSLI